MKCKKCGAENGDAKRTCGACGAFLEGYTLNNVTGEYGYRGADGNFYKSEEEFRSQSAIDHRVKGMQIRRHVRNLAEETGHSYEETVEILRNSMPDIDEYLKED